MCVLCIDCIVSQVSICTIYSSSGNLCIHYISAVRLAICWSGRNKRGLVNCVTTNTASFYPWRQKNDIPSTNCESLVFVLLMTGLLPPPPRHKCGVRVWWQRCGLSVLSIPVASGPAVLHQAALPTLASSSSILYRGWSPLHLSAVFHLSSDTFGIYTHLDLDQVFLVTVTCHNKQWC